MGRRRFVILVVMLAVCSSFVWGQRQQRVRGISHMGYTIENGDTMAVVNLLPIRKYLRRRANKRYLRMVRAVKRVYPLAQEAKREMSILEEELKRLPSRRDRQRYIKGVQQMLIKKYTPVIKKMTIYEGSILLKLIDRETDETAYDIVRDFRGGFVAGFWQTMAKMFGNNLKTEYDPEKDDRLLEEIVRLYEAGQL